MPAGFQYVVEADEVAFDVGIGVGDAVAYAGLSSQIDYHGGFVLCEKLVHTSFVGDGLFDEHPVAAKCFYLCESFLFEIHVVVVGHRVYADDFDVVIVFKESHDEVAADESGCSGHEDGFSFE